jgi:hypothetical protein
MDGGNSGVDDRGGWRGRSRGCGGWWRRKRSWRRLALLVHSIEQSEQTVCGWCTRTTGQRHAVVDMPVPARLADMSVGWDRQALVEEQSEAAVAGKWAAAVLPPAAPLAAAQHRALTSLARHQRTRAHTRGVRPEMHTTSAHAGRCVPPAPCGSCSIMCCCACCCAVCRTVMYGGGVRCAPLVAISLPVSPMHCIWHSPAVFYSWLPPAVPANSPRRITLPLVRVQHHS